MEQATTNTELFNKRQAATLLNCSEITVHRLTRAKKLGSYRVGSRVFISRSHIEDYLRRSERKPKEAAA